MESAAAPELEANASSIRRTRWSILWLAVLASAWLVEQASERTPTGPDDGTAFHVPSTAPASPPPTAAGKQPRVRFGTFNIHGGRGIDGQRDLGRIADCLNQLDFVGLNEVHGALGWGGADQAEQLGRKLGLTWLFAPTEHRWWHDHFGNGAATSFPVRAWQRIPLNTHGSKSGRNALLVSLDVAGRPLNVLVTHVDASNPQRSEQLRAIVGLFLALAPPAVLLGDLNTTRDDPLIERLLAAPDVVDVLADSPAGRKRIDWIVARGLKCTASGMYAAGPSDHPQFWAELEANWEWGMGNGE